MGKDDEYDDALLRTIRMAPAIRDAMICPQCRLPFAKATGHTSAHNGRIYCSSLCDYRDNVRPKTTGY